MKMEEAEDTFAGVVMNCETTESIEEELYHCPFSRESETFPAESSASPSPSPEIPESEATGIIMLSVPDSDTIDQITTPHENEEFETPPEHHNNSETYFSGSDDPRPIDVDGPIGADEDATEAHVAVVDLGKDSDELGFSGIDVGNGNLGNECPDAVNEFQGDGINEVEYTEGDPEEPMRKKVRVCEEDLDMKNSILQKGKTEAVVVEIDDTPDVECEEIVESQEAGEGSEGGNKEGDGAVAHESDNIGLIPENVDAGVVAGGSLRGRRELPLSMRGEEKNVGGNREEEALRETELKEAAKNGSFNELIEALAAVLGQGNDDDDKDIDFLEIAKRRGMKFPRPRWWPPEGFGN